MSESATYTPTQRQRLIELGAKGPDLDAGFASAAERDAMFAGLSKTLRSRNIGMLEDLRSHTRRAALPRVSEKLAHALISAGFSQVATPSFLSKGALAKMGITEDHDLWKQIFWLDKSRCLRPMLAPNLYFVMGHLQRYWPLPLRIFEIGSCFRKESKGSRHLEEFTMLNLVELGCDKDPLEQLKGFAAIVMEALGLDYELEEEASEVYGTTLDVVCDGVEVASGATGPHPLDDAWNITEPWAGLGVGVERAAMLAGGHDGVHRVGRSLIYLDGARLNI